MDSEKIIQDLNRRFAAPLPEFYKRRIIVWIDEDQEFVIEVVVRAVLSYLPDTLASRRELDLKQAQVRLHYLLDALSLKGDLRLVV